MSINSDSNVPDTVETFDELITVSRQMDERDNPRYRYRDHVVLRDNRRTALWVEHAEFLDKQTGEIHHDALKLSTVKKTSMKLGNQYFTTEDEDKKIWINNDERREVERLRHFINAIASLPDAPGEYLVVPLDGNVSNENAIRQIVSGLTSSDQAVFLGHPFE